MQDLSSRVQLPRVFNRPFRSPLKNIKGYTMEEYLNLVRVGASFAALGPPGFKYLWRKLCFACAVYLCTHGPGDDLLNLAGVSLHDYLRRIEVYALETHEVRLSLVYSLHCLLLETSSSPAGPCWVCCLCACCSSHRCLCAHATHHAEHDWRDRSEHRHAEAHSTIGDHGFQALPSENVHSDGACRSTLAGRAWTRAVRLT